MYLIPTTSSVVSVRLSETFTGDAWGDRLTTPDDDPQVYRVSFAPGARTYWHRHAGGQLISAVHGSGFAVGANGRGGVLRLGESVWTPPGEVHWHGAAPGQQFAHLTYSFGDVEWLNEVGRDDYVRGVSASW